MNMLPSSSLPADSLEGKYFAPIFRVMKANRNKKEQDNCPKPSTVKIIMNAVSKWMSFFNRQEKAEIDTLLRRLDEFHKSIKPDSIQRKTAVKEWKASTTITPMAN